MLSRIALSKRNTMQDTYVLLNVLAAGVKQSNEIGKINLHHFF